MAEAAELQAQMTAELHEIGDRLSALGYIIQEWGRGLEKSEDDFMKLEEQVVSLELAKQLKELGVKQESFFIWQQTTDDKWYVNESTLFDWGSEYYAAFTVTELGELLPRCYISWATPQNGEMKWWCHRMEHHFVTHEETPTFTAATEADARAKMLMYISFH